MTTWVQAIAALVISIALPFIVNLCAKSSWSKETKRGVAIVGALAAGAATGVMLGVPTPESLLTWAFAIVGGVQTAYAAFKSIGVTSNALDALEAIEPGNTKEQ